MIEDIILENNIYKNDLLQELIISLEQKYCIHDEIDFFNNLVNFSKNGDVPYHRWFKYREGYSHALIKELIKRSGMNTNEYVLDPFCGAGTTIVEAAINGYDGLGIDINPMSALISEVKCTPYSYEEILEIRETTKRFTKYYEKNKLNDLSKENTYEEVERYFSDENFRALLVVKGFIDSLKEKTNIKIYNFFFCAYLCIIEDVSDRKRDGNGLRTSLSKITNVYEHYLSQLNLMIEDIMQVRINDNVNSKAIFGNAMIMKESVNEYNNDTDSSVGAIIYSPPYANSFDYFESYKLEIVLGDFVDNMREINKYRKYAIASFIGSRDEKITTFDFINWMADEIEKDIPLKENITGKRDSRTRKVPNMIRGYFSDMAEVIAQSAEILPKGKKCYIVVDQSAYLGKLVPTDLFLAYIGEQFNFMINEIIVCRKAKTSGQQLQKFPYLKNLLRESIVVMEKK